MHIVHYLEWMKLEAGGVTRAVLDMGEGLAGAGHQVTLLTTDRADTPAEWDGEQGRPGVVEFDRKAGAMRRIDDESIEQVEQVINAADVVHLHGVWDPTCRHLARMCQHADTPYVISIHGMLDDWCMAQKPAKKRVYLALGGRSMLEQAAAVHCTAAAEAQQAAKWFPRGRAVVVPLLFDLDQFRDLPGPEPARAAFPAIFDRGPIILFLSRLHIKKGLEHLIGAAAILKQQGRSFVIAIAGTGEQAYVRELQSGAQTADVADHIEFVGFAGGAEKISLFQTADIFALPTSQENWGFVLVEAMASGTAVLTTQGVDIWPELQESGGAEIIDPDPGAFAEAIGRLLDNDSRREQMAENARAWALEHLEPERVVGQYEQMYRDAAET